jgi:hypothetical protein
MSRAHLRFPVNFRLATLSGQEHSSSERALRNLWTAHALVLLARLLAERGAYDSFRGKLAFPQGGA